jgi:hypothetical protein
MIVGAGSASFHPHRPSQTRPRADAVTCLVSLSVAIQVGTEY